MGLLHNLLTPFTGRLPVNPPSGIYPAWVWYQGRSAMHDATRQKVTQRLKRIEGQVGGVLRMVEDNRYCIDMLTQISAIRAALHKVEEEILRDHVNHCVANAFASGDITDQRHKVEELVQTLGRMTR
ncbi:MAG TPA: metal-sensitive transcriptional regulator [Acidocella sp.]|nr:metal-sensitive transcriptional regulator [Acidocella sp.]